MAKLLFLLLVEKDYKMEKLNDLELATIKEILEANNKRYSFLKLHLQYLRVKNREYTGVGIYSNFEYSKVIDELGINDLISSPKRLMVDKIKNELSYVLDITNGKIKFLEIVTNGNESWDGTFKNFHFI